MVAPYSTVGGYGGNASLSISPTSGQAAFYDDLMDGVPTLHPYLTAAGTGPVAIVVDPSTQTFYGGYPEINAMVVELRIISALLREQMGNTAQGFDLQMMRADEAWNTSITTGAL